MKDLNNGKLWLIFFMYTLFVSALVQFVLLPFVLPDLHAGHGLLKSSFDSIGFHDLAMDLTAKMRVSGWSAWQLRPSGQSPAGIASVLYYLICPDPRILIPISAALHATAALSLFSLLNLFVKKRNDVILCVLPFLVFPSNWQWTAQWHRDGFSILGAVMMLQGIVLTAGLARNRQKGWFPAYFRCAFYYGAGIFFIWIARPYVLTIIDLFVKLVFSIVLIFCSVNALKKRFAWHKTLLVALLMLLVIFTLKRSTVNSGLIELKGSSAQETKAVPQSNQADSNKVWINKAIVPGSVEHQWTGTQQLPMFIESKAFGLAQVRRGFRFSAPEAKSNIDRDIGFGCAKDILMYVPRAIQVVFLSPFPSQWFENGSSPANSLMRRISAFEMLIVYFALLCLPFTVWYWRRRIELWIIVIFCFSILLIYGLAVCNIGTLYRMRYLYIMTLAALGIAGFTVLLDRFKAQKGQPR